MKRLFFVVLSIAAGCSEYRVHQPAPIEPADPPGSDADDLGSPPDWATCTAGYLGQYYNLEESHPDVSDDLDAVDPDQADWWDPDRLSFQRFDASLDMGSNWWPVDEGLAGDPDFFAARWTAWMRVERSGDVALSFGATTDGWVFINDEIVASVEAKERYNPEPVTVSLSSGQVPLVLLFAHRGGDTAAFRFRVAAGDVTICYPDFSEDSSG